MKRLFGKQYRNKFILLILCSNLIFLYGSKDDKPDETNDETDILKVNATCNIKDNFFLQYKFYLNNKLIFDVDEILLVEDPLPVFCNENVTLMISKKGDIAFMHGFNKILLFHSIHDSYIGISKTLSSDIISSKDYAIDYKIDIRENRKDGILVNGVYLLTKKGYLIYCSLFLRDIGDTIKTGEQIYCYENSFYEEKNLKLHIYKGFMFVVTSKDMKVMRYDNNKRSFYDFYFFGKQKIYLIQEGNIIHIWGNKDGILVQFIVEDDYIEIYRWGEKKVIKIDGKSVIQKEESQ